MPRETFTSITFRRCRLGARGSFYAPALLLPGGGPFTPGDPILPRTNIGTIQLRFTSQGDIEGSVTSTDSTQKLPIPIHVQLAPMRIFTLRSEEHTSELQSRPHLVCRLLLEK